VYSCMFMCCTYVHDLVGMLYYASCYMLYDYTLY